VVNIRQQTVVNNMSSSTASQERDKRVAIRAAAKESAKAAKVAVGRVVTKLKGETNLSIDQEIAIATLFQNRASTAAREVEAADLLAQNARVAAGPPPVFNGKTNDIEVHKWLMTFDRWCDSARIAVVDEDGIRITTAVAALRNGAVAWWQNETTAGRNINITWKLFTERIMKQFLPMEYPRWALGEISKLTKQRVKEEEVQEYTTKFRELVLLLPIEPELTRMVRYEEGLPEFYKIKCREKNHTTLEEETNATLVLWNARQESTNHPHSGKSTINNVEEKEEKKTEDQKKIEELEEKVNRMEAAAATSGYNNNYSSDNNNTNRSPWRPRNQNGSTPSRGRSPNRSFNNNNDRSRSRSRARDWKGGKRFVKIEVSNEVRNDRMARGVCIKCNEANHFARDCTNQLVPKN
jgi:hypothetical protein